MEYERFKVLLGKQIAMDLGFDVGENWEIPRTSIVPRMFIMTQDKDGHDIATSFSGAGIKPGSKEFFDQILMGNVFVYKDGQKEPMQMQIQPGSASIKYSEPVTEKNIPAPPVKPLTFFQKIQNFFTGKFKKQKTAWVSREQDMRDMVQRLKGHEDIRSTFMKKESEDAAKLRYELTEGQKKQKLQQHLDSAKKAQAQIQKCTDRMVSVFRPDPVFDSELCFETKTSSHYLYNQKQFDSLEKYPKDGPSGIDLDKIKIGNTEQSVTAEDFTAVTMFALWGDEPCEQALKIHGFDKYAQKSLEAQGFSAAESKAIQNNYIQSYYTGDLFMLNPRGGGGQFFKDVTNLGRKAAVDAFKDYQNGNKEKLASIIADGINKSAHMAAGIDGKISAQDTAWIHNSGKLIDLMDKDPELKAMAEQKGMKSENLDVMRGFKQVEKLQSEANNARVKIEEARLEGRELSSEEKLQYGKAIIKSKLAVVSIAADNLQHQDALMQKKMPIQMNAKIMTPDQTKQFKNDPESRPDPGVSKDGKPLIWGDTAIAILGAVATVVNPVPKAPAELNSEKKLSDLDKQAELICKKSGVGEKSMDWIHEEFGIDQANPKIDVSKMAIEVAEELQKANVPKGNVVEVNAPAADKDLNIAEKPGLGVPVA